MSGRRQSAADRPFWRWLSAALAGGGAFGGIVSAYSFVDQSMKPSALEAEMHQRLLNLAPQIAQDTAIELAGNRPPHEAAERWTQMMVERRRITLLSNADVERLFRSFMDSHDSSNRACKSEIGGISETLSACIRYYSYGAPRIVDKLSFGSASLVGRGTCTNTNISNHEAKCTTVSGSSR